MIKRINVAFSDDDHAMLLNKKEELRKKYELKKLSWESFIMSLARGR